MDSGGWVGLADAIRMVRGELVTAMREGRGEELRFGLGQVEMEFLVDIRRERTAEGGLKVWVISATGKDASSVGVSHRIKVALTPEDLDGREPKISAHDTRIPPP